MKTSRYYERPLKAGDDSVTWVEPKVLKKLAAQAEAEGEGNV